MTTHTRIVTSQTFAGVVAAISALVLLPGCKLGPNYTQPAGPVSEHYDQEAEKQLGANNGLTNAPRINPGQKINGDWWTAFASTKLDQVMRRTIDSNFDLAAADATIAQASEAIVAARGGLYPQIDAGGEIGRARANAGGLLPPATASFYAVGPAASFDFDVFGGIKRSIERQGALADFERHRYDAAYLTLTGDVAKEAILQASARAQVEAVQILLADDRRNLELTRGARLTGSATQVDVSLAETQLSLDQTLLPPLVQQYAAARHALSILAGKGPNEWASPDFDLTNFKLPPDLPVTLPSEIVRNRPDLLEAEAELHATSAAIGIATADLYPHLTLSGFIDQTAVGASSPFGAGASIYTVGAGLAGPVFHGGTLRANRRGAIDAYKASLAIYQQTVVNSLGQVADVLQAIYHDAEEYSAQDEALNSAGVSLRLNREGYREGEVSVLEVLDSERSYEQALLGQIRAKTAQYLDTTQFFVALGGNSVGAFQRRAEFSPGVPKIGN
jgi:NodT family efflux transporter outer membrane factor (OMF) lipoprotein